MLSDDFLLIFGCLNDIWHVTWRSVIYSLAKEHAIQQLTVVNLPIFKDDSADTLQRATFEVPQIVLILGVNGT